MTQGEHILYCDCAFYDLVSREDRRRAIDALKGSGISYSTVSDLCELCADGDERLHEWAKKQRLLIIACYPRAVRWLFDAAGVTFDPAHVDFFNLRLDDEIERLCERLGAGSVGKEDGSAIETTGEWVPWFPVIDHSRCINCQKCLDFCLFGTYALLGEGEVQVKNPRACKTNCPACARICPQKAIIFPKHDSAPINGAPIADDSESAQVGIDHDRLFQGDIFKKIKERGKRKRFSKDAHPQGRMEQLRDELGIPPDVLANLSPTEIAHARERLNKGEPNDSDGKSEGSGAG